MHWGHVHVEENFSMKKNPEWLYMGSDMSQMTHFEISAAILKIA